MFVALDTELMLVGERQGIITGPGSGRPPAKVLSVFQQIVLPRSPATGQPTGRRHHKRLVVGKEFDAASIGIEQASAQAERLTEVRLRCFRPTALGIPKHYFTIQLFDANICELRTMLPDTRARTNENRRMWEKVSLVYLRIRWTWTDPPMVAEDDWLSGR
jgi:type VI secretion system secreted protein Hcp